MENIQISTTQNIDIDYEVASIGERLLAGMLDFILLFMYFLLCMFIMGLIRAGTPLFILIFMIPAMCYHLIFELFFNGRSLGKMITGIKVVKIDGSNPRLSNYLIRWIFRLVDVTIMAGSIATITIILSNKGQRLGDMAAKTTVIRTRKRVSLGDTLYQNIPETYEPKYIEAINLRDSDISTISDVIANLKRRRSIPAMQLANKTKAAIENRLGIKSTQPSQNFLETIVKDYTYLSNGYGK